MKTTGNFQKRAEYHARRKLEKRKAKNLEVKRGACGVVLATAIMTSASLTSAADLSEYKVNKKDTLYKISQQYGVSVEYIQQLNGKKDDQIQLGEILLVPTTKQTKKRFVEREVEEGDTWYEFALESKVSVEELMKYNNKTTDFLMVGEKIRIPDTDGVEKNKNPKESVQVVKVVDKGDSLWKIAREYRTTVEAISVANNLKSNKIKVGQQLKIDGITQVTSTIVGAADGNFIEFKLSENEIVVLKVTPFYNVDMFTNRAGLKTTIQYNAQTNELISYKVVN